MTEELKKRLEEAAQEEQRKVTPHKGWGDVNYGFIKGAGYGYKEAIALAKEWLLLHLPTPDWYSSTEAFVADFEADMKKLWEEQK